MEIFIAFIIGVVMGIILSTLIKKRDGRLVIDDGDYFVAISTPPSELEKKGSINLKVVVTNRGAQE